MKSARYRLGTYDPTRPEIPVRFHPRVFRRMPYDLAVMKSAVEEFTRLTAREPNEFRCMAIFPYQRKRKAKP